MYLWKTYQCLPRVVGRYHGLIRKYLELFSNNILSNLIKLNNKKDISEKVKIKRKNKLKGNLND
jgi:hypothetical protein